MSVKLGSISVGDIPLGAVRVAKAYLGDTLVFVKGGPVLYLEIEPDMIWVNPDWEVSNNVYSNTNWNIN